MPLRLDIGLDPMLQQGAAREYKNQRLYSYFIPAICILSAPEGRKDAEKFAPHYKTAPVEIGNKTRQTAPQEPKTVECKVELASALSGY